MGNKTIKIQAMKVAGDIRDGMDETALMLKYDLSRKQLRTLMQKLREAGLLETDRSKDAVTAGDQSRRLPFKCPACGVSQSERFDECPLCGVVVSKFSEGQREARTEPAKTVSDYGASLGGGTSDLMSTKHGTRLFSIVAILVIGIGGIFAYKWLAQSRSERALIQNVRPMLEYLVDEIAGDFNWKDGAEKFNRAVQRSRGPFQSGDSGLHANLDRVHDHMVRIAALTEEFKETLPKAERELRGRLQPQIEEEMALLLEDKLASVREEVVPKLIAERWNEFAEALKHGRVQGNPEALKHFSRPPVLNNLKRDFERQMSRQIGRRLQKAEDMIRNREFLNVPPSDPERFVMRFPSRFGKLEVHAEINILSNVFDRKKMEGKLNKALDRGIESALASEETHGLEANAELESIRTRLEQERSALVTACRRALDNMNRQE